MLKQLRQPGGFGFSLKLHGEWRYYARGWDVERALNPKTPAAPGAAKTEAPAPAPEAPAPEAPAPGAPAPEDAAAEGGADATPGPAAAPEPERVTIISGTSEEFRVRRRCPPGRRVSQCRLYDPTDAHRCPAGGCQKLTTTRLRAVAHQCRSAPCGGPHPGLLIFFKERCVLSFWSLQFPSMTRSHADFPTGAFIPHISSISPSSAHSC